MFAAQQQAAAQQNVQAEAMARARSGIAMAMAAEQNAGAQQLANAQRQAAFGAVDTSTVRQDDLVDCCEVHVPGLGELRFDGRLMRRWKYTVDGPVAELLAIFACEVGQRVKALPKPPTIEQLARALFDSDDRVRKFVTGVADEFVRLPAGAPIPKPPAVVVDRYGIALQRAWDRDERGWRTEAEARAAKVLEVLHASR